MKNTIYVIEFASYIAYFVFDLVCCSFFLLFFISPIFSLRCASMKTNDQPSVDVFFRKKPRKSEEGLIRSTNMRHALEIIIMR